MNTSAKPLVVKPVTLLTDPGHFLALGFGSGCAPVAPGTFGTLAALPLCWLALHLSPALYAGLTLLLAVLGVYLCGRTALALGGHDHPAIVWDELVGIFLTMLAAPKEWYWLLLGFVLFRFFDILKPWPVSVADQSLEGGFGIMADDILAAAYAWLVLQLISYGLTNLIGA
ncbi:MAG: phosphatidylglycerophosphatase A [Candidatus Competibacteraceae bacterium]|nr:phosphatidylglycerophosphatase A [Candidatus Competibacteraceae bacterium]MCB1804978.1 phosphatidylglycerophosphatase A [Candidatus Competibacteraceae bacterium]MCB1810484.1 phosphatidylglycerophosphatase A [Candidatus Competibacteraceae bacterium]